MTAEVSDPVIVQGAVITVAAFIMEAIEAVHPLQVPEIDTNPQPRPLVHPEIHTVKARLPSLATSETLLIVTKNHETGITIGTTG